MYQQHMGSAGVHVVSITGLPNLTQMKGFVRYAAISQLTSAGAAAVCKVTTKHFSQPRLLKLLFRLIIWLFGKIL